MAAGSGVPGAGLQNVICTISPQKIILGGGVMKEPALLPHVRGRVQALASGYFDAPELGAAIDEYIVPPALGDRAGVLGRWSSLGAPSSRARPDRGNGAGNRLDEQSACSSAKTSGGRIFRTLSSRPVRRSGFPRRAAG